MAHEAINTTTGKAHVAFGREHAWHRLGFHNGGQLMTVNEGIAGIQPEALEVSATPYYIKTGEVGIVDANGMPVLDSTGNQLMMPQLVASSQSKGIITASGTEIAGVGIDWTLLKNEEFFNILKAIAGDAACVDSIGIISEGSKIFASLASEKLPSRWIAGDEYKSFLTVMNAHNGTMRFMIFWSLIRVVCANTWKMSLSARKDTDSVFARKHTAGMAADIETFVRDYDKAVAKAMLEADKFAEKIEFMDSRQFDRKTTELLVQDLLGFDPNAKKESLVRNADGKPRKENQRAQNRYDALVEELLNPNKETNPDNHVTAKRSWDVLSEAIDHGHAAFVPRNTQGMEASQLQANYALFGKGQTVKDSAFELVLEYATKHGTHKPTQIGLFAMPQNSFGGDLDAILAQGVSL